MEANNCESLLIGAKSGLEEQQVVQEKLGRYDQQILQSTE